MLANSGQRIALSGNDLTQYENERTRLVNLLKNRDSDIAKFLLKQLDLSSTRITKTVLGQRPFDGTLSTLTMKEAGLQPSNGIVADVAVDYYFSVYTPNAGTAIYASSEDKGATLLDVYFSPSGLKASTILHESLHSFYGTTYPDDKSLATKLGVSDADYSQNGSETIDKVLENNGL